MIDGKPNPIKITFPLPEGEWHGFNEEKLWCLLIDGNTYTIDNSPFLLKGVSYRDVISAEKKDDGIFFSNILKKSGHSTYRVILNEGISHNQFTDRWSGFKENMCTFEHGDFLGRPIYSIDVPPSGDIFEVYHLLELGNSDAIWDFEEADLHRINN